MEYMICTFHYRDNLDVYGLGFEFSLGIDLVK